MREAQALCPGQGGLVIAPTVQLTMAFKEKGCNTETFQTVLRRGHLKYVSGRKGNGYPRWAGARWLVVTEVFQLWAHQMDALLALIETAPQLAVVILDGDPFQHGAVCSNGSEVTRQMVLKGQRRKVCSKRKGICVCAPMYASKRFLALFPAMEKVRLLTNHRLSNRLALSVVDEIQKLGLGGRSDWKAAIEDFVSRRLVKAESVPDDDSVFRVAHLHKTIRRFTEQYYGRKGVLTWDKELCLHDGCTATVTVSKRLPGGRYAWFNGQKCCVVAITAKHVEVALEGNDDDDDDDAIDARSAALLETGAAELRTVKLPRRDKTTGSATLLPDFIHTSFKAQGTTRARPVVYLDERALSAAALYVMFTRGDDVQFVCERPQAFFRALYDVSSDYDAGLMTFYAMFVAAAK
jgi:hypothetical protein